MTYETGRRTGRTSPRLLPFGEEFHCGALEWRGHFVGILEVVARPIPELLHIVGHIIGGLCAIVGDRCGHLRLLQVSVLSLALQSQSAWYRERQDAGQHLRGAQVLKFQIFKGNIGRPVVTSRVLNLSRGGAERLHEN